MPYSDTLNFYAVYGSPKSTTPTPLVKHAKISPEGLRVQLVVDGIQESHIHDFDLANVNGKNGHSLLHTKAYDTVNEIPQPD